MKKSKSGKDHLHIETANFEIIPEKSTFRFVNPAHATQGEQSCCYFYMKTSINIKCNAY